MLSCETGPFRFSVNVRFPPKPDIRSNQQSPLASCCRNAYIPARQRAGRPRLAQAGRGKSGLHGTTVPGNARPVLARVSRESATERIPPAFGRVRSKGCGKSAPRRRQRHRHGKPHRVQDRIGAAYGPVPARRPGWLLEGQGNLPPRGMAAHPLYAEDRTRLTGPLAIFVVASVAKQSRFALTGLLRRCAPAMTSGRIG